VHLIVGDLNLPYVNWNVFTGPSDDINSIILKFVIDNSYNQLENFETRGSNLLDVLLTDTDTLITSLTTSPPIGNSDHITIEFSLSVFCDVMACNKPCIRWSRDPPRKEAILGFFDRPPYWICNACVGTTHKWHLVVFITVQNLIGIGAVVLIIRTFFNFSSLA